MTEGSLYEFKIAATNLAGIGQPSDPSEHFMCEAWTAPEPGEILLDSLSVPSPSFFSWTGHLLPPLLNWPPVSTPL